jgi:hypothetical protein
MPDGLHVIMLDMEREENDPNPLILEDVKGALLYTQYYYKQVYGEVLPEIFITSDRDPPLDSFHVYCFKHVELKQLIDISLHTSYVDFKFIKSMIKYERAFLRYSRKRGRPSLKVVGRLEGESVPVPQEWLRETYETGTDHIAKGISFNNGRLRIRREGIW